MHYAAAYGYLDIVQFLVEYGADVNAKDECGYLLGQIHRHEFINDLDERMLIVDFMPLADLKPVDAGKAVTLEEDAEEEDAGESEETVVREEEISVIENKGMTVLDYVIESKNQEMVDWLKAHDAKTAKY